MRDGAEVETALQPGPSMMSLLPGQWTVAPSDQGGWYVLGGHLPGDPEVMVTVDQARGGGRDLGESVAWLLAELLATVTAGNATSVDLSEVERSELSSRLRLLLRTGRDGR